MVRDQRIRDPIHNLIKFSANKAEDQVLWSLIQKPAFQRLRRIKQLGLSEIVYPGAAHTRLSHSLGTMQMARRMLEVLERNDEIGNADDHELWRCATLSPVRFYFATKSERDKAREIWRHES